LAAQVITLVTFNKTKTGFNQNQQRKFNIYHPLI